MSMVAPLEPRLCRIEQSLGRTEICPGANCPLWEQAGSANGGSCLFESSISPAGRISLRGFTTFGNNSTSTA